MMGKTECSPTCEPKVGNNKPLPDFYGATIEVAVETAYLEHNA
jgi:hypothetical protein